MEHRTAMAHSLVMLQYFRYYQMPIVEDRIAILRILMEHFDLTAKDLTEDTE